MTHNMDGVKPDFVYYLTGIFPISMHTYSPQQLTSGNDVNRQVTFAFNDFIILNNESEALKYNLGELFITNFVDELVERGKKEASKFLNKGIDKGIYKIRDFLKKHNLSLDKDSLLDKLNREKSKKKSEKSSSTPVSDMSSYDRPSNKREMSIDEAIRLSQDEDEFAEILETNELEVAVENFEKEQETQKQETQETQFSNPNLPENNYSSEFKKKNKLSESKTSYKSQLPEYNITETSKAKQQTSVSQAFAVKNNLNTPQTKTEEPSVIVPEKIQTAEITDGKIEQAETFEKPSINRIQSKQQRRSIVTPANNNIKIAKFEPEPEFNPFATSEEVSSRTSSPNYILKDSKLRSVIENTFNNVKKNEIAINQPNFILNDENKLNPGQNYILSQNTRQPASMIEEYPVQKNKNIQPAEIIETSGNAHVRRGINDGYPEFEIDENYHIKQKVIPDTLFTSESTKKKAEQPNYVNLDRIDNNAAVKTFFNIEKNSSDGDRNTGNTSFEIKNGKIQRKLSQADVNDIFN